MKGGGCSGWGLRSQFALVLAPGALVLTLALGACTGPILYLSEAPPGQMGLTLPPECGRPHVTGWDVAGGRRIIVLSVLCRKEGNP